MESTRTRLRRAPQRGSYDPDTIFGILDESPICHVGFVVDAQPFVIPTIHARIEDQLYLHGAAANRMLGTLGAGAPCCITATLLDGLVMARSAFHHSMNYRSVVVVGQGRLVTEESEKRRAFDAIVDHVWAGRSADCRPANEVELRTTQVIRVSIDEASAKVRTGPPLDDEADLGLPHWAGVVPLTVQHGEAIPDAHVKPGQVLSPRS